jgi:multidrug efflux system membrane fusion protein
MASRFYALLFASPLLLVALGASYAQVNQAQLPRVTVSHPLAREVTDHTDFVGRVEPGESIPISARGAGEVVEVAFKPGTLVKKGDALFRLDSRMAKIALQKVEAEAERAQAIVRRATADLARVRRLADSGAVGKEEVESAAATLADAEASLKGARAGVELARLLLEQTTILAPIAGKAGRTNIVPGSLVTTGTSLVTLTSTDTVHIAFDIDQHTALRLLRLGKLKKGSEGLSAQVGLPDEGERRYQGVPDFSDLRFDSTTGTAHTRVTLPNADGLFLPGMSANVRLIEGKPYKALLVTSRAIQSDAKGYYVLVVNDVGVLVRRDVKFGRTQGGSLLPVTEGLKVEDQVVVTALSSSIGGPFGSEDSPTAGMAVESRKVAMPERPSKRGGFGDEGWSTPKSKGTKGKMKGGKGIGP